MKSRKIISVLLVMCLLLSAFFIPCTVNASTQTYAQTYLDEQMEFYEINGVAYVTKNGEVICQSARGMANTAESKEMTIDTLFPIGSISKQFCATAILLLQEQGKLSVDEPISKYFPEYTVASDVTIKNLLTMRSGIRNHLEGGLLGEYELSVNATKEENHQIILDWLYTKELLFEPDTSFTYSNGCFLLLSIIVEKVTGQSYTDFIKENIFTPLGMNNSGFYEELMYHPDLAEYTGDPDLIINPQLKGLTQGCGDLVSNAKDMDKWLTSLRECTILSEESIAEMTTNYSSGDNYGYGVFLTEDGGVWHGGDIDSYSSMAITYPEDSYNVMFFTNYIDENDLQFKEIITFEIANHLKNQEMCGDVNCDGKVDIMDATTIQKHIAGLITLTDEGYAVADVDDSETVNVMDATAIQKYLAGIDTSLPIGEFITLNN